MRAKLNSRRFGTLLAAGGILVVTAAVLTHATQTFSVPNAATFTYNLAAGANSAPITPVANQAVFIIGTQTAVGYRGVASATILHIPASFIEWVGLESTYGAAITSGYNSIAGTHILYLDFSHQVDVQVAGPDTIWIHNGSGAVRTGNLKLIW